MSEAPVDLLRLLLVDDDDVDRMAVRRALRTAEANVEVTEADSVAAAREALGTARFDSVLVDYNLPDGSGRAVLEAARAAEGPPSVIVLTGQGDEGLAVELMKEGARDYIPKQHLSPARLMQSLRYAVEVSRAERETRKARRAQQFVADVSAQLGQSLDYQTTLERIAHLAVPEMADYSVLHLVEGADVIRRAAASHVRPELGALLTAGRRFHKEGDPVSSPLFRAIGSGDAVFVPEVTPGWFGEAAEDPEHLDLLRRLSPCSLIVLPLMARGRTLGGLTVAYSVSGRHYDGHDLTVLENVAGRVALALDNARLYQDLREEVRTVETLRRLGETITAELDLSRVVQAVTERATDATGAAWGAFCYTALDERGKSDTLRALSGVSPEDYDRFSPSAEPLLESTYRRRSLVRAHDLTEEERLPTSPGGEASHAHGGAVRSFLAAPVVLSDGEVVGALLFGHPDPGAFTERDERIVQGIASWAAVAFHNARLYEGAQRATRARDDMLAVVSHDLRNPLNVIATGAALILEIDLPEPKKRQQLETIRRTTDRMNRLIQDLLDVTGVESGKLSIHRERLGMKELLEEAREMMTPLAAERGLILACEDVEGDASLTADRERMLQVFSNLVGNAIKFTPEGGRVSMGADRGPGIARFWVEDTGPGISEEDLPRLFDRFWRGKDHREAGAGLGLPIAKGIVEVHGGTMTVDSAVGRGTRFTFTLPLSGGPSSGGAGTEPPAASS